MISIPSHKGERVLEVNVFDKFERDPTINKHEIVVYTAVFNQTR
jgi:hypothetical protein